MSTLKYFNLILLIVVIGCSSKTTTTKTTTPAQQGKYSEDISVLRPKVEAIDTSKLQGNTSSTQSKNQPTKYVEAKYAVNETLDGILDSISEQNLIMGLVDGFTIQVYSGLKREEALNVKKQMASALPDVEAEVQYVQPNFRVRVGKYYDRYDAQRDYQVIKHHFPNAIILPERVPID